ncbi:MAG: DUF192 domain-containing protein [Solirubrobacterales bacterium]
MRVCRLETERGVVCARCAVADTPPARLRGLLGRRALRRGTGVWLRPARSVHTWFMRFAIDVVFLDAGLRVVGICASVEPWRMAGRRAATSVLELAAGEADRRDLRVGDTVRAEPLCGADL